MRPMSRRRRKELFQKMLRTRSRSVEALMLTSSKCLVFTQPVWYVIHKIPSYNDQLPSVLFDRANVLTVHIALFPHPDGACMFLCALGGSNGSRRPP